MSMSLERELEEAVVESWPAAECQALDGWLLRSSGGPTHRGNSVATLAAGAALSLSERLSLTEAWYQARGQRAQLQVGPCAAPAELDAMLEQRGYRRAGEALVMTAAATLVAQASPTPAAVRTSAGEQPAPAWRALAAATSRFAASTEVLDGFLARLAGRAWFVTAWLDGAGAPAQEQEGACGMALGIRSGRWLGVYAMHTRPDARRRGAGRALLRALAQQALHERIQQLYLLVEHDNAPACALYAQSGFQALYGYHYRVQAELPEVTRL